MPINHDRKCAYLNSAPVMGDEVSLCNCGAVKTIRVLRIEKLRKLALEMNDDILWMYSNILATDDPVQDFDNVIFEALRALAVNRRHMLAQTLKMMERTIHPPIIVTQEGDVDFNNLDLAPGGIIAAEIRRQFTPSEIYFMDFLRSLRRRIWKRLTEH